MLEDFITANCLTAKIFQCKEDVNTAAKAALIVGDEEAVAKSIVLVASNGGAVLVILLGKDKIEFKKLKEVLGVSDVRLANAGEVFDITGYEIGGVPPISIYGVKTILDAEAGKKQEVVCGGGDAQHLMRIKVKEIIDSAEEISVQDVRK